MVTFQIGELHGNRREWSMADAAALVRAFRGSHLRPTSAAGITITVANFKGRCEDHHRGDLAQGLAMRGHRVLIPIWILKLGTTLFGVLPDAEVSEEHTAAPLFAGDEEDLRYAIRSTYWPGIDLVCAAPLLFGSEFALPHGSRAILGLSFGGCWIGAWIRSGSLTTSSSLTRRRLCLT